MIFYKKNAVKKESFGKKYPYIVLNVKIKCYLCKLVLKQDNIIE